MANVKAAIDYVLSWEDPSLAGVVTVDDGGRTRFGIAEKYHPELTNCLFYTSMGSIAALAIAEGIYREKYADPLCIELIASQTIANKLLSLGVNIGSVTAAAMLQDTLSVVGDGRIGPLTLHALDGADQDKVLAELRERAEDYYKELVQRKPEDAEYLRGWLRRAEA